MINILKKYINLAIQGKKKKQFACLHVFLRTSNLSPYSFNAGYINLGYGHSHFSTTAK